LCPISYAIFKNPVIAEDGYIYEHDCIYQWFSNCRSSYLGLVSPLTKESLLSSKLVPCQLARQMVDTYLTLFPDKKINQYVCTFDMKIMMHYLYHSVSIGENYIRSIDTISLEEITFYQMQKCVKVLNNTNDPLLRVSLWETLFKKIEDIHESFKNEKKESTTFSFEEEDVDNLSVNNEYPELSEIPPFSETTTEYPPEILERNVTIDEEMENLTNILSQLSLDSIPQNAPLLIIQTGERELEEGEIEEENQRNEPPTIHRNKNKKNHNHHCSYSYKRSLLGCLCFHANKRILEIFLKTMPVITCPKLKKRYSHVIEDFIRNQNLTEKIRSMENESIERLQNILLLMLEKGIPYHGWTRNGKQTILSMMYFTLDHFYPMFSKLQLKIIEMPEFFDFPPGASSGSMTSNKLLRLTLSESISFHMSLKVWDNYQANHVLSLEDIWDFCVKYSEYNIWIEKEWNKNNLYEKVMFDFIKKRGSIPMELVLLKSFSSWLINHCFIEGYRIENEDKLYSFPHEESIIAPIIQEDTISKKIYENTFSLYTKMEVENTNTKKSQKSWKINMNTPGGRLRLSRHNLSTKWSWDTTNDDCVIQPEPKMSVLGWLIYHYNAPIVLQYLENNMDIEIDMNSNEFTGLEYVNPIHLVFRYYNHCKNTDELLDEMIRRGACLHKKTSHGWLPIHYACRYSPNLIDWIIDNVSDKEKYLNEILHYQPSSQILKINKQPDLEWYQDYLPFEILTKNGCLHNSKSSDNYNYVMNKLILSGAKRIQETNNKYYKDLPFLMEEPITFEIGSFVGNGNYSSKKRTRNRNRIGSETSSMNSMN
jgi:hypothetical protein